SVDLTTCGTTLNGGLTGARAIALNSGGDRAYVAATNGALTTFSRVGGTLAFQQCRKDRGSTEPACVNSPNPGGLAGAKKVVVAPAVSGGAPELVYVVASASSTDAVTTFTTDGDPLVSE